VSVQDDAVQQILLNEKQIDAIIDYAKSHNLYDGTPPSDLEPRRTDAATLVYQARRARSNGNSHPDVLEICFIAEVDQNPQASGGGNMPEGAEEAVAATPPPVDPAAGFEPAAPAQDGELDLTKATVEQLSQMIEGLLPHQSLPAVAAEIAKVRAEQERRASVQEPPPAPTGAPPPQPPALPPEPPGAAIPPPPAEQLLPEGVTDATGALRQLADAAPSSAVQAPESGVEGGIPEAQPDAQAGRRASLERQLTGEILAAYGKSFSNAALLSDEELVRMLTYPKGPVAAETTPTIPPAGPPERTSVSPERDALEGQVTGPMLKAWRRGRADIPGLIDDDLRQMIANPNGPSPLQAVTTTTSSEIQLATQQMVPPAALESIHYPLPSAEQIIAREHFPIAPEVDLPPVLPFDISKLSDDELRSVHAQFHAVLCRANWVIAEHREQIADRELLLAAREVEVKNEPREGKATKDQMAALVAADPKVVEYTMLIAEMRKPLNKLEVIADNARSTCARCSRDFSMRYKEAESVPSRGM
jgi:hypothetical protein